MDKKTEKLLEDIEMKALDNEARFHGCSQCALEAIQDNLNIGNSLTLRSVSALASGVALMGETCGALIAGIIALGLVKGRQDLSDFSSLQASLVPARKLYRWFKHEYGSTMCRDVQSSLFGRFFNIADLSEYKEAQELGLYNKSRGCPTVVGKVARKAAELILTM